jgi:hypothetical protein
MKQVNTKKDNDMMLEIQVLAWDRHKCGRVKPVSNTTAGG